MRKTKRGGGDLARSSHKNRRACETEWVSGCLLDEDSNQDVCTELSDVVKSHFRKSVASISLCNGDITLFSCSGIAIARHGPYLTRFLTSASLARAFDGKTNEHYYDLKIKVCHEGKEVYRGFLAEYDLDHNFAVVNVRRFIDVHVGIFECVLESVPYGEAYVVGRGVSGDLMARSVELGGDLRVSKEDKDLDSKTSEAWEGGSVFSFDGKFIGMNLFLVPGRAVFLPWSTISKRLECYWTSWQKVTGQVPLECLRVYGFGAPVGGKSNSYQEAHRGLHNKEQLDLDSMGYPKLPSTMLGARMILVNTFEETFGDMCGKGVWSKLSGKAAFSIRRNVVALASFNGGKRIFACTGFFIKWNGSSIILTSASLIGNSGDVDEIVENLRIEVLLPDKKCVEGKLEHHDPHYNVALVSVSVEDRRDLRPANTRLSWSNCYKVAAVGRCFKSGALMAMGGELVSWTGTLDCDLLVRSSCKITKAGIGGPLVTLDGDVLGMNFYDKEIGTPFLLWGNICEILESFKLRSKAGETESDPSGTPFWKTDKDPATRLNRWPVTMPCWRLSDDVEKDKPDDDVGVYSEYSYDKGKKILKL
ncbi:uncharacterized protein LOC101760608 isoform X1 [Setaria italica]|uniref:uncharacterized protein LOC101760608 isoform X1 n=2 Tax=Setaria italica TaxID=4555 RepID=UPI000BE55D27|nr:uncharacterized protein LOC101760608 isoform X1 [Setaria italica]XP_022682440.1 uncharacterized protein LOC101760608 isoform X1 [Setaria italica]